MIAKDSLILMQDGTQKKIEDMRPGDKIQTIQGGISICEVITGIEESILLLEFDGKAVKVMPEQCISTVNGIFKAEKLSSGINLDTIDGKAELTAVSEIRYEDRVFAVKLDKESLIICNGLYMCDFSRNQSKY